MAEATPTFLHPVWNKPATYNAIVYIEGDTEPGATVTVDGAEIDVGADGHFNVSVSLADILAGQKLSHSEITVVAKDTAGNEKKQVIDVYRLKAVEKKKGFAKYESAQWWALVLSIVILVMAIITAWLLLRASERNRIREEEEEDAAAYAAEGGR
jgi:flagellar biosynthesis/type III secretory pathway M-ring protein FliF/YscJ